MSLYFNPQTALQVNKLSAHLPQAILLVGEPGAGLLTTARHIAKNNIAAIIQPTDREGNLNHTAGSISVKRIRELYTESSGKSLTSRIFIIDDADRMSTGAQNAFLKLLEEPTASTHFILTSHRPDELLATITSRVEQLTVIPITRQQTDDMLLGLSLSGPQAAQALFIATGKPAELSRLAFDQKYFTSSVNIMTAAKIFVSGNSVEAIEVAFKHAERSDALLLLQASKNILLHSTKSSPTSALLTKLAKLNTAYDAIAANGNAKLHLMSVMV